MRRFWNVLSTLFSLLLKQWNMIIGVYFLYLASRALQNPAYSYVMLGIVFLFYWLHDESRERKSELETTIDNFKSEVRTKLVEIKLALPKNE